MLRPGTHVLRRSATELQVGLDPARAVVLPDRPEMRLLLRSLTSPATALPAQEYDDRTIALLADAGLLVDADALLRLTPSLPRAGEAEATDRLPGRPDVAALAAHVGEDAARLLTSRARARVELVSAGSPEVRAVADQVDHLLRSAGLQTRVLAKGAHPPAEEGPAPADTLGLLVAVGEPPREVLDPWMRRGTEHLLVRLTEGTAVVGPFVLPGRTACLRCVDGHHTDADPAWPLLVTQYASAVVRGREDAVPEPVDAVLASLASAWAARELVTRAEGRRPPTTSTTIHLDPHLTALETRCWPRHPACGCGWA